MHLPYRTLLGRESSLHVIQVFMRKKILRRCGTNIDGNRMMRNQHLRGYRQLRMNIFNEKISDAIAGFRSYR